MDKFHGICVQTRGATARGGVRDQDLNMWEGGESSGDNVGDRSAGSIRRRDRDTRRVRERGGRLGAGEEHPCWKKLPANLICPGVTLSQRILSYAYGGTGCLQ